MIKFSSYVSFILVTALIGVSMVACDSLPSLGEEEEAEPLEIGTLLDYTGDLGVYGKPMRNGAELAVTLLNDSGMNVVAVHKDSGTDAKVASDAARALQAAGVSGIVGSLSSGVTTAVAESVTIPGGTVLVSPASTAPSISVIEDNDLLFRSTVSDAAQGSVLGKLADELGYKKVGILYVNNPYGDGLQNIFTANFSGTVQAVPHEGELSTYMSEVTKATEGGVDALIAMSYPGSAQVYIREALEGGFADTFMFVDGTKSQDMLDSLGANNFEGMYGTAPGAPPSDAKNTFEELYEARFGEVPSDPFLGETFDAFVMIALATEKCLNDGGDDANCDGAGVAAAMRDVSNAPGTKVGPGDLANAVDLIRSGEDIDFEGVAGSQEIDDNGDVLNSIEIWTVKGGKIESTNRFEAP